MRNMYNNKNKEDDRKQIYFETQKINKDNFENINRKLNESILLTKHLK